MKILLTGATGFIGKRLVSRLTKDGHSCVVATRHPETATPIPDARLVSYTAKIDAEAVINLAGETVAGRWTVGKKERILTSRVNLTENLVANIAKADSKPKVLLSASATGFYGDRGNEILTEASPIDPQHHFLAQVCEKWEGAANKASELGIRVVNLRTSNVLDPAGGMLAKLLPPLRLSPFIVPFAPKAYIPWISMEDEIELIVFALQTESISGPMNLVAPNPETSLEFHHALGRILHRLVLGKVPDFVLKVALGEFSEALLASERILPQVALDAGYQFRHPDLSLFLLKAYGR